MTAFACIAVLLSAIGIYGVISFSVGQRMRELAIRAALGATPVQVRRTVIQRSLGSANVGIALGTVGTFALAGYMKGLLFGVQPLDSLSISCAGGLVGLVAIGAALLPARKAGRLDPVEVLRSFI